MAQALPHLAVLIDKSPGVRILAKPIAPGQIDETLIRVAARVG